MPNFKLVTLQMAEILKNQSFSAYFYTPYKKTNPDWVVEGILRWAGKANLEGLEMSLEGRGPFGAPPG